MKKILFIFIFLNLTTSFSNLKKTKKQERNLLGFIEGHKRTDELWAKYLEEILFEKMKKDKELKKHGIISGE